MSLILSLETTTNICSVALHQDGKLIASKENHSSQSHSRLLAVFIRDILKESDFNVNDLNAVAVSQGPGSYTGVRIGVSTAKGLCYSLAIPLIAVNTLLAMAHGVVNYLKKENHILCPMIDARRMEVYTLLIDTNANILMETKPLVIDENSFDEFLKENKVVFFGNGALKCKSVIKHTNAIFIEPIATSAIQVGMIAADYFKQDKFEDLAYFEPNYLKEYRAGKPKL